MNTTLESTFVVDPFNTIKDFIFEDFDPVEYFYIDPDYQMEIFNEASDATKKNIMQKIIDVIKRAFNWISDKVNQIKNGIKKLTNSKARSANQIAKQIGLQKHDIIRAPADPNDPKSAINAAESLHINFIEGISEDGILILPSALIQIGTDNTPIKGKEINAAGIRASQVVGLITHPKILDEYIEFFKQLTNEFSVKNMTASDITRIFKMCEDFSGRPSILSYGTDAINPIMSKQYKYIRITIEEMNTFQLKVDEMNKVCAEVDNAYKAINLNLGKSSPEIEKHYLNIINKLSWASVNLQGGLLAIGNGMQGIYHIDPGYWDCINNPEMLSSFVKECMKYGMPGKYLVNNIYRVCDKSMKGSPDLDHPLMGFGRLTLIPKDKDFVYKVAFNQYGVRSNKNDFIVMKSIAGTDIMYNFAFTGKSYDNIINVMEKVNAGTGYEPSVADATKLGEKINIGLNNLGIQFQIYDIKPDAFGQRNGKYVLLDYGYIHRRQLKAQNK